jgi:hypothetical protein
MDTLDDYVMKCLSNGQPWTFWTMQDKIYTKTGKFYGEATISQAIRNVRKDYMRKKYDLPDGEVVLKQRIDEGKGYYYRINPSVFQHWSSKNGIQQ